METTRSTEGELAVHLSVQPPVPTCACTTQFPEVSPWGIADGGRDDLPDLFFQAPLSQITARALFMWMAVASLWMYCQPVKGPNSPWALLANAARPGVPPCPPFARCIRGVFAAHFYPTPTSMTACQQEGYHSLCVALHMLLRGCADDDFPETSAERQEAVLPNDGCVACLLVCM